MNFLAHCLLSGQDSQILIGNLMTDFLKPDFPTAFPEGVVRGIQWHYQIDRFMDSHPLVAQSRARLFPKYRHYGAVLVDLFYDHLLATHWDEFCEIALPDFAHWVYRELEKNQEFFPLRMREVIPLMIADDWLCAYATPDGVRYSLHRVELRARRALDLSGTWDEFCAQKSLYETEFCEFFPQIVALQARELLKLQKSCKSSN